MMGREMGVAMEMRGRVRVAASASRTLRWRENRDILDGTYAARWW